MVLRDWADAGRDVHFRLQASVRCARAVLDLGRKPKSTKNPNAMKIRLSENFRAIFYARYYAMKALGLYTRQSVYVEFITFSAPSYEDCVEQGLR